MEVHQLSLFYLSTKWHSSFQENLRNYVNRRPANSSVTTVVSWLKMKFIHDIFTSLGQVWICATWDLFHNTIDILLNWQEIPQWTQGWGYCLLTCWIFTKLLIQKKKKKKVAWSNYIKCQLIIVQEASAGKHCASSVASS